MKNKIILYFTEHKIRTVIIVIIVLASGYYGYGYFFTTAASIQYTTQAAEKTTITISASGSGQVSELNSIDLKPALGTSNTVIAQANVKTGDEVKAGDVVAVLDQKSSRSSLTQAQSSLTSAKANLDELLAGATADDIKAQQNSINQAEQNYNNALVSLELTKKSTAQLVAQAQKTLDDLKSTNPPGLKREAVISAIQDKLISAKTTLDAENKMLIDEDAKYNLGVKNPISLANAQVAYSEALSLLTTAYSSLGVAKLNENDANINTAVNDAINILNKVLYSENNFYDALQAAVTSASFTQTDLDSFKSSASGAISSMNSGISSLQSAKQALVDAITSAQNSLDSANLSLTSQLTSAQNQIQSSYNSWQSAKDQMTKLKAPATQRELDVARAQVRTAQAQLETAQNNYNDNVITAPFDGRIAVMNVQKGDQVSGSTIIATLITNEKIATLSLNEVDAAKIKVGDKVITTFDAIDGLSITGKVAQIDMLGTVSQGVVTYTVKVSFDTQDDRVKPDMSANCEIITDVKTDVIAVPNASVKTSNDGSSYVQMLDNNGQPQNKTVEIGIANDSMTEIVSGLNEGDKVVAQTITTGTTAQTTSQNSGLRIPGVGGGGFH